MRKLKIIVAGIGLTLASTSFGKMTATAALAGAIPTFGLVYATSIGDTEGALQVTKSLVLTGAVTTFLKYSINRRRPDGTDQLSFPSGHASIAFCGATFLHMRYGLKFGIPMYLGAAAVSYERVDSDKHYWGDVIGGAAVGILASFVHTTRYGEIYPAYNPKTRAYSLNFVKKF